MDSNDDTRRRTKNQRETNLAKHAVHDKNMLSQHITAKLKTTMIGALAKFEGEFSYLWTPEIEGDSLTDEQLDYKERWQFVRTEILNLGNAQLRAALQEIDQYTIKYNKHEYTFVITEPHTKTKD